MSNTSRRFVLVEAMLLLAPVTVLAALGRGAGLAWAGAAVGIAGALGGVWLTALGNGWIFAIGSAAVVRLLHLWWLRNSVSG